MDLLAAIRARRSVRTYLEEPLSPEDHAALEQAFAACSRGPFGTPVRFLLVELAESERSQGQAMWTYGVIRHATTFIAGALDPKLTGATYDFGHCFERVVLEATRRGLGTCWLGGTFRASVFAARVGLPDGHVIPCVSPVGHGAQQRTLVERALRTFAGSDRRKPWDQLFFGADGRPLSTESAGRFAEALECLRLAPSASNKQPWRVFAGDSGVWHFGLARNAMYDRSVSPVSLQEIDLGIGLCHFEVACRELGLAGSWTRDSKPALPEGIEFVATFS